MATDIKKLKNRIRSIDSTLHLTKAMGLVAATKVRGASELMVKSREYAKNFDDIIAQIASTKECEKSVYMQNRTEGKTCLVVIAGDRGLAGGYNSNIFKLVDLQYNAEIFPIGKRACERYENAVVRAENFDYVSADALSKEICRGFEDGKYNKVCIASTKYVSMMSQVPEIKQILPLEKSELKNKAEVVFEPDAETILGDLVKNLVASKIFESVRESFVCELVARRLAMDSAGKNATQIIEDLRLEFNQVRQAAITQEITEIIAGS